MIWSCKHYCIPDSGVAVAVGVRPGYMRRPVCFVWRIPAIIYRGGARAEVEGRRLDEARVEVLDDVVLAAEQDLVRPDAAEHNHLLQAVEFAVPRAVAGVGLRARRVEVVLVEL